MRATHNIITLSGRNMEFLVFYRSADKSLARPEGKHANVSVRMA